MKEIITPDLGTVVEKEEITRYSIEYKLENRNKVFLNWIKELRIIRLSGVDQNLRFFLSVLLN